MHRYCAVGGVDMLLDFREFLGSDERKLVRELRAAEADLKSDREALHQLKESLETRRGELHECEASHRFTQQELHDLEREETEECMKLRAEEASLAAEVRLQDREARREVAEAECTAYNAGLRRGEEMMLVQFQAALARAVQCGREEGSAEIRAEFTETAQSLRDQLATAIAAQLRSTHEFAVEAYELSQLRAESAHEIAELRKDLSCARQESSSAMFLSPLEFQ
eukprot:TRINITY_DN8452_c0_g2_i1.p1 TRINITY_DN8452_c0_g2~~TRINITY_DN8452_c0_g2_i1.p1  ORF type:complete len:225 (+),score=44.28 TRINITY_DN8452_c0_g2_i1:144-818(+)